MDIRPTRELVLPDSQAKIILYANMTNGDYRQLQREVGKNIFVELDETGKPKPQKEQKLNKIAMSTVFEESDFLVKLLIKEAYASTNEKIVDLDTFIYNLTKPDGDLIYSTVEDISKGSILSDEAKKK